MLIVGEGPSHAKSSHDRKRNVVDDTGRSDIAAGIILPSRPNFLGERVDQVTGGGEFLAQIHDFGSINSARGMIGHPEVAGVWLGEFRHLFEATPTGSSYRVDSLIGVDWPVIGSTVNWLLRTSTFNEAMLREWERHQIEEVANLRYFLPQLYAQRAQAPHYVLKFEYETLPLQQQVAN